MEPPGTAPGSDPLMTSAFMSIVRVAPDRRNIGGRGGLRKRPQACRGGSVGQRRDGLHPHGPAFAGGARGPRGVPGLCGAGREEGHEIHGRPEQRRRTVSQPMRHGPGEEPAQAGWSEAGLRRPGCPRMTGRRPGALFPRGLGSAKGRAALRRQTVQGMGSGYPGCGLLGCPGGGRTRAGSVRRGESAREGYADPLGGGVAVRACGGGRRSARRADQKPALIFSNSSSIRSRIAGSSGVWASSVVSTGSSSAAFSASGVISAMAASFVSA